MIKKINVFVLIIYLFTGSSFFAQTTEQYKSKEIYDFSRIISEAAKDRIWTDFEPLRYLSLKTEAGKNYISFTSEPDNPNGQIFWTLFDEYFLTHSLEENLVITFHEAFHAFETDAKRKGEKWGAENAMLVFEYQESSARNNALFNIESRILRMALESKNKGELKRKAREFLSVRHLRQSDLEPKFVEFEKGAELNEGLAEYVGTKAVVEGIQAVKQKRISIPFLYPDSNTYLQKKYEILNTINSVGKNVRRKFYYTGSTQGFLLDRLMTDWKTKVQMKGKALQDLLETSVGEMLLPKDVKSVLRQYSYENVLGEEEKLVAQRKADNQALLKKTLNQKGRKYIIDYSALNKPAGIRNFDPMNVTMVTPTVRVHTRSVKFAGEDSFTANFSQPVVEDLAEKRYITVVTESEKESVTVDGIVIDLTKFEKIRFQDKLMITSPNFNFEAHAGTIEITDQGITVKLASQ